MRKFIGSFILLFLFADLALPQGTAKTEKVVIEDDQNYVLLVAKRIQTMEKELEEVAAKGFRVMYAIPSYPYEIAILLGRGQGGETAPVRYKLLSSSDTKTIEQELSKAAQQGDRLLSRAIISKVGFRSVSLVMLMEHDPQSNKSYEYKLIAANKETKLHKRIDEEKSRGFVPVTMVTMGKELIILEKVLFSEKK